MSENRTTAAGGEHWMKVQTTDIAVSVDGHVGLYRDDIDLIVWQALATINGGDESGLP